MVIKRWFHHVLNIGYFKIYQYKKKHIQKISPNFTKTKKIKRTSRSDQKNTKTHETHLINSASSCQPFCSFFFFKGWRHWVVDCDRHGYHTLCDILCGKTMSCQPVILDVVSLDFNLNRLKSPFLVHYLTKAHNGPHYSVHLNTFDYFREGLNYFPVW